tara:strand:+ start:413 stop:634 length:222 start_codon:yes stop_codon:yes gene_type:complete
MKIFKKVPIDWITFENAILKGQIFCRHKDRQRHIEYILEMSDYMDLSEELYTDTKGNLYTFNIDPPENLPSMF